MTTFEYVGPFDEVTVPTVGLVKQGDVAEFPADLAAGADAELWKKTTKKAAKAATTDTPAGGEDTAA